MRRWDFTQNLFSRTMRKQLKTRTMTDLLTALEWRYATKSFNSSVRLTDLQIDVLKKAVQLSVSSFGLQPYKVFIIDSLEVKSAIMEAAYGQKQIGEASHVFVFAHQRQYQSKEVEELIVKLAENQGRKVEELQSYQQSIDSWMGAMSDEKLETWMSSQVHIAMNNLLLAAATLGIDSCPMGGFDTERVDDILGLKSEGLKSCLIVPVGVRNDKDIYANYPKTRKSISELFEVR
ncbi:MAG: NAD(P)H-dependent oxidoreductase [Bacteroidetes bacterium]|nr:MAG: NAD(P)H-dependent oxidoreductase [Bacteroidota bacterium]